MRVNVEIIAIGIDIPMTRVARILFKKSSKIKAEIIAPIIILSTTEVMDILINVDVTNTTAISTSEGRMLFNSCTESWISFETTTVIPYDFFKIVLTSEGLQYTSESV